MSHLEPDVLPWDGRCRCDKLRIRVVEPPIMSAVCHCRGCQRMSSSAFSLTLMLPADGLEIVRGESVVGGARDPTLRHMFCDDCKTWVFTRIEAFGVVNLRASMLDEPAWFTPFLETYASTKLAWVSTPAVQAFDTFPPPESYPDLMAQYADWARARNWPVASDRPSPSA